MADCEGSSVLGNMTALWGNMSGSVNLSVPACVDSINGRLCAQFKTFASFLISALQVQRPRVGAVLMRKGRRSLSSHRFAHELLSSRNHEWPRRETVPAPQMMDPRGAAAAAAAVVVVGGQAAP